MYFVKEMTEHDGSKLYLGIRKTITKVWNMVLNTQRFMGRDVQIAGLGSVPKGTVLGIELKHGVDGLYYVCLKTIDVIGTMLYTHGLEESNRWDTVSFEELALQTY